MMNFFAMMGTNFFYTKKKKKKKGKKNINIKKTSEAGLEPATYGLGGRCATITPHGLHQ